MSNHFHNIQARFTQMTDLSAASPLYPTASDHKFALEWEYPDQGLGEAERPNLFQFDIKAVRVYRYIGDHKECLDPRDVPEPLETGIPGSGEASKLRLVYSASQEGGDVIKRTYRYDVNGIRNLSQEDIDPGDVTDVTTFEDNLEEYYITEPNSANLSKSCGFPADTSNKVLLNQIYSTERPITYLIATYVDDTMDAGSTIAINAQGGPEDRLTAYSTKTQVKHDVLHYEFDLMWTTIMDRPIPGNNQNISRTSIDIDALNRDDGQKQIHRGPNGRGGSAWVSCRGSIGYVFRINLSNGLQSGVGCNPTQNNRISNTTTSSPGIPQQPAGFTKYWGHGITVDIETGNCWSGSAAGSFYEINNILPSGNAQQTLVNSSKGDVTETGQSAEHDPHTRYNNWGYSSSNWEFVSSSRSCSYKEVNCTAGACAGYITKDVRVRCSTVNVYDRDPPDESIGDKPVEYQLGVFGAANNKVHKSWLGYCVKDGISKNSFLYKSGNTISIGYYQNREEFEIKYYSGDCDDDYERTSYSTNDTNFVQANFSEWLPYYDYFHEGGTQWVNSSAVNPVENLFLDSAGNATWTTENLNTGNGQVTVAGQGDPTGLTGPWNTWSIFKANAPGDVSRPHCINNTPDGRYVYIDSNLPVIKRSGNTPNSSFNQYTGTDTASVQGTSIVADRPELFPNRDAEGGAAAAWPFVDPYANTSRYKLHWFSVDNKIYLRSTEAGGWDEPGDNRPAGNNTYNGMALDIDDSNNVIGFGDKRIKIYRMDTAYASNSALYPVGPASRYPSVPLDDQPYSILNTREIEWFLTRDHYEMEDTVTKTTPYWTNLTARGAWCALVNFNRFEADTDPTDGTATVVSDDESRGWDPATNIGYGSSGQTTRFGIRMLSAEYDPDNDSLDDPGSIIQKIRTWYDTYCTPFFGSGYLNNRLGRYLHPNNEINTTVNEWRAHPSEEQVSTGSKLSDGVGGTWYRMEKNIEFTSSSDSYNQLIPCRSTVPGEYLHNYDLIHPEITIPTLFLKLTGSSEQSFLEDTPFCYPWPSFEVDETQTALSSYDDTNVAYTLYAHPGTYIIKNWYLQVDDYPNLVANQFTNPINHNYTIQNNQGTLTEDLDTYLTAVQINHTYFDPTIAGRIYLDDPEVGINPFSAAHIQLPRKTPIPLLNDGTARPLAWITAKDIYEDLYDGYNNWTWTVNKTTTADYQDDCILYSPVSGDSSLSAQNFIEVYERWPEPRFYQNVYDDSQIRQDYFRTSAYAPHFINDPRYDKSDELIHVSQATDAVRKDVFIGVEPLSSYIQDRSIARSFPISSRTIQISTNSIWSETPSFSYYLTSNDTLIDVQSPFTYLTGHTFKYGTNLISMTAEALSGGTISDRVFNQCVDTKEMEPFAYYATLSGQTVPSNYTAICAVSDVLVDITSGNAQFNSGDYYISGYAPYVKISFLDKSFAHTFPISSYHWDFGDIYNEGPADIFDPESNYYTLTADNILSGSLTWTPGNKEPWKTDISDHTASHVYVTPGQYTVTMTARASNTGTSDTYSEYPALVNNEYQYQVEVVELPPSCGEVIAGLDPGSLSTNLETVSGQSPITGYFSVSGFIPGSFIPCEVIWEIGRQTESLKRVPQTVTTSQGLSVIYDPLYPNDLTRAILPVIIDTSNSGPGSLSIGLSTVICNTNTVYDCASGKNYQTGEVIPEFIKTRDYRLFKTKIDDYGNIIYVFTDDADGTIHTVTLSGELSDI